MPEKPLDRRTFAAALAATGAALVGCGTAPVPKPGEVAKLESLPAELKPEVSAPPVPEPVKQAEPSEMPPLPDKADELVLELVKLHYPERLEADHLKAIRGEILRQLARSQVLSSFPLKNSDEPAPVFAAYRGPE